MDLETLASPGAEAQIAAPVAEEIPESAPETEVEAPADPEAEAKAERDKAIRNLQRRVDRKHAQAAAAEERARLAEQRIADLEARTSGSDPQTQPHVDPIQLAEQIATLKEVTTKANTVAKDGAARFPDFKEALRTVADEAGPLFDARGLPTGLGESVLDAEDPAAVLHYLGLNPEVASELQGLKPTQIARRIARIELDLAKPKEPKQSTAPKPVTPVRAAADGEGLSDNLSMEEWSRRFYKRRRG